MSRKQCDFEVIQREKVLELILQGEIDHHSAVRVRTEIDRLLMERQPEQVILDLSRIDFMDSSGLGLIMGRYALMQRLGGELILRNPSKGILRIFELAGLGRMVKTEEGAKEEKA